MACPLLFDSQKRFVRHSSRHIGLKSATVAVNWILAPENGFRLLQSRQPTSSALQWSLHIDSCVRVASQGSTLATMQVISDSCLHVITLTIVIIADSSPLGPNTQQSDARITPSDRPP
jgi:hypothetical protein